METLINVPDEKVIQLFKGVGDTFENLPNDKQILTYYQRNLYEPYKPTSNPSLPSLGTDTASLKEVGKKYPKFEPLIEMFIRDPKGVPTVEQQKTIWQALGDPKNFKKG